jgi:hypothetical protein
MCKMPDQTAKTMTPAEVAGAICTLDSWSNRPMTDEQRAGWRVILRSFTSREFAECVAKWSATRWGKQRPNIGDLAQFRAKEEPKTRDHAAEVAATRARTAWLDEPIDRDELAAGVALCRHALSETRARHPSSQPEP